MTESTKLLSIEDSKEILLKDLKHENFSIKSYNISSLSDKIEGFLGEHFLLTIEYDLLAEPFCRCKKRYFMKVLSGASKVVIQMTTALNAFAKEEFFYNFLMKEFTKCNIDTTFAPKAFICKSNIIVLEDLSVRDYKGLPKSIFFDLDHCKQALATLAKLHSSSITFEKQFQKNACALPQEFPEMFKSAFSNKNPNSVVKKWFENSLAGIIRIIHHVYENDARKKDIIDKLETFVESSHAEDCNDDTDKSSCNTVLHGDVWLNNFLFKYNQEHAPIDCVLIDYQLMNYGPPSLEVLHLLYCNTRRKFRNAHIDELVDFYYDNLQKYLSESNIIEFLPKEEYLILFEKLKLRMKLQCICDRCVTFMPDKYVHERVRNDEDLRKYLFEDRAEVILACFKKEESFRELLLEDLEELIELLFKNVF